MTRVNAETIATFLAAVCFLCAAALFAQAAVRADAYEECMRMQRNIDDGHPVTLPDWCE
jgi:hypothetical protein